MLTLLRICILNKNNSCPLTSSVHAKSYHLCIICRSIIYPLFCSFRKPTENVFLIIILLSQKEKFWSFGGFLELHGFNISAFVFHRIKSYEFATTFFMFWVTLIVFTLISLSFHTSTHLSLTMKRCWWFWMSIRVTEMMAVLSSMPRAWGLSSLSDPLSFCRRLGPKITARFAAVILLPEI